MASVLVLDASMIVRPGDRVIASRVESNRARIASTNNRRRAIAKAQAMFSGEMG